MPHQIKVLRISQGKSFEEQVTLSHCIMLMCVCYFIIVCIHDVRMFCVRVSVCVCVCVCVHVCDDVRQ